MRNSILKRTGVNLVVSERRKKLTFPNQDRAALSEVDNMIRMSTHEMSTDSLFSHPCENDNNRRIRQFRGSVDEGTTI
jgi:hypothetical protein